jgi:hypothetical protein
MVEATPMGRERRDALAPDNKDMGITLEEPVFLFQSQA